MSNTTQDTTGTMARPSSVGGGSKREQQARAGEAILGLRKLEPVFQPPRIVLNAVEGWGKTSCAAFAPDAAILMAKGETGYQTLLGAGLVPQIRCAYVESWESLLDFLARMADAEAISTGLLALDALGGFERLCHEHVCHEHFEDNWGEKGFTSYQKGYEMAITDWLKLLAALDAIQQRGVTILVLGHTQIRPFKNPLGEDYDRYVSDVHHKTWGVTHKWADAVLFGQFATVVDKERITDRKGKGIGGTDRVLHCEHRDAFDAKNRYGLRGEMKIPEDPSRTWSTIWDAIQTSCAKEQT